MPPPAGLANRVASCVAPVQHGTASPVLLFAKNDDDDDGKSPTIEELKTKSFWEDVKANGEAKTSVLHFWWELLRDMKKAKYSPIVLRIWIVSSVPMPQ